MGFVKEEDLLSLIESRRSVRVYTDETIPEGDIRNILNAGRWTPTLSKVQSWHFGVVQEEGTLSNLKNISPGVPDSATLGLVICSDKEDLGGWMQDERKAPPQLFNKSGHFSPTRTRE